MRASIPCRCIFSPHLWCTALLLLVPYRVQFFVRCPCIYWSSHENRRCLPSTAGFQLADSVFIYRWKKNVRLAFTTCICFVYNQWHLLLGISFWIALKSVSIQTRSFLLSTRSNDSFHALNLSSRLHSNRKWLNFWRLGLNRSMTPSAATRNLKPFNAKVNCSLSWFL